ncbi:hypothetical protein ACP70R_027423 [Stipagrostis hirtigluma subsp. patula]
MEDAPDEGAAAASAAEAALGFHPQLFVNEVLNRIDDCCDEAFDYCRQKGAAAAIGEAKAAEKAAELERGINGCQRLVKNALDKRMSIWEKYCLQHCFTVPEGFTVNEDAIDNSCAKESHTDGTSDSDLDAELDSLRRKLESANKESEDLQREMSSLQRQAMCKRKIDSTIDEIKKLFEEESVQKMNEDLAKAVPKLQQKLMAMQKKSADTGSLVYPQIQSIKGLRDNKRLALDKGCVVRTEDIQEVVNIWGNA